ncbi:MAG: hypothetical protein IPI06_05645 [Gammaproteobacteria bacterium]|nr:hypothetical protein [Gammaproteobacteria bacterium]
MKHPLHALVVFAAVTVGCTSPPERESRPENAPVNADFARVGRLLDLAIAAEGAFGESRWEDAGHHYDALLELDPGNVGAWHRRGILHLRARRFAAAQLAFEHALALEPARAASWHDLAIAQLGQAYQSLQASATLTGPVATGDRPPSAGRVAVMLRDLLPPEVRP